MHSLKKLLQRTSRRNSKQDTQPDAPNPSPAGGKRIPFIHNNLLEPIVTHLSIPDLLNFRASGRTFCQAATPLLRSQCKRLYLHATRLEDVHELCACPSLRGGITEIVLLGMSTPSMEVKQTSSRAPWCNRTWPQSSTPDDGVYQEQHTAFATAYSSLLEILGHLVTADITTLRYAHEATEPGWCPVSKTDIQRHGEHWRVRKEGDRTAHTDVLR
jgi:hypothetical protein